MTARGAGRGSECTFSDRFGRVRVLNVPDRQINAIDRAFYQLPDGAETWEDCPLGELTPLVDDFPAAFDRFMQAA